MQKMNIMPHTVFEILKFKKSCNLNAKYSTFGLNFSCLLKYLDSVFQNLPLSLFSIYDKMSSCKNYENLQTK